MLDYPRTTTATRPGRRPDLPTPIQHTDLHDLPDSPSPEESTDEDIEKGPAESVASSDEESTEEEGTEPVQPTAPHNAQLHNKPTTPPAYLLEL